MREKTYGQIAYETYCGVRNWKSVRGEPLPQWDDQKEELQIGWLNAAAAVLGEYQKRQMALSRQTKPGQKDPAPENLTLPKPTPIPPSPLDK